MRVEMRIAGVSGAPGQFFGDIGGSLAIVRGDGCNLGL